MISVTVEAREIGTVRIEFRGVRASGKTFLRRHVENRLRLIGKIVESRSITEGEGHDRLVVSSMLPGMEVADIKSTIWSIAKEHGSNVTFS